METINQQLNITPTPRNSNMRSKMARGANDYQVQLGTEDPSLDFYNDIQSISNYHNANGWGEEGEYNNFLGIGYPACIKLDCKNCKNECKTVQGLKWGQGGKECHKSCMLDKKNEQMGRIRGLSSTGAVKSGEIIPNEAAKQPQKAGMSTGAMIGIGAGVLLLVVGVVVIMKRKK